MAKEFFKDLPNTTTPLSSARLNGLLDGDEPMGNIRVDSIKSKNMILSWQVGGIDATVGSEYSSQVARRTGFIEVDFTNVSHYYVSGMPSETTWNFIAAYNSSMQFLGRTGGGVAITRDLTSASFSNGTPQGTGAIKYLRIALYNSATDAQTKVIQLEEGNQATTCYPFQNLDSLQIYSTMETKVGTWIDGYNIYRKVITFDPETTKLQTSITHNISNIKEILPTSYCILHRTNNSYVPFGMAYPNSASDILAWSIGWQITTNSINTWIGSSMRGQIDTTTYGAVAVIEYTKTTN